MTTSFEHPGNGYRVQVNDGSAFVWTLLFGGFFFLVRGSVRHFFIGLILGACTFGLSWLIYPFFAAGILRTMYFERGYREVPTPESSGSLAPVFLLLLVAPIAFAIWYYQFREAPEASPSSTATARATPMPTAPSQFSSVAEAQKEAMRRYPELAVAGSKLNTAFVARYKAYQQQRPDYFREVSWPLRLAEEVTQTPQPK
jgi:hypothetical protein